MPNDEGTTEILDAAHEIRAAYTREAETIDNDNDLTDEARAVRLSALAERGNARLRELSQRFAQRQDAAVAELRRKLVGVGSRDTDSPADKAGRQTAYNAALDRAEAADDDELVRLLERAARTDTELLARAVLDVGLERGHAGVVRLYGELYPKRAELVKELSRRMEARGSRETKLAASMAFSELPRRQARQGARR